MSAMRTTDFCFPLPDYEHPRLVRYRRLFEALASLLAPGLAPETKRPMDLAFHDARLASVGSPGFARGIVLPRAPVRAVPLTPCRAPGSGPTLSRETFLRDAETASCAAP